MCLDIPSPPPIPPIPPSHTHTPAIHPCSAFTHPEWCGPHPVEQIDWGGREGDGEFTPFTSYTWLCMGFCTKRHIILETLLLVLSTAVWQVRCSRGVSLSFCLGWLMSRLCSVHGKRIHSPYTVDQHVLQVTSFPSLAYIHLFSCPLLLPYSAPLTFSQQQLSILWSCATSLQSLPIHDLFKSLPHLNLFPQLPFCHPLACTSTVVYVGMYVLHAHSRNMTQPS